MKRCIELVDLEEEDKNKSTCVFEMRFYIRSNDVITGACGKSVDQRLYELTYNIGINTRSILRPMFV